MDQTRSLVKTLYRLISAFLIFADFTIMFNFSCDRRFQNEECRDYLYLLVKNLMETSQLTLSRRIHGISCRPFRV